MSETVRLLESFLIEDRAPTPTTSRNSSQSTSTSSPVESISTPMVSVAKKNTSSTSPTKNLSTKISGTNNQTIKNQDALTLPITHAEHLHNPPPPYPKQSRRRGEEGKVVIAVEIDIEGTSSQAVITNLAAITDWIRPP